MRRADGRVLVGLQTGGGSGDPSRDVGSAAAAAVAAEPGTPITLTDLPADGPRLQDVVAADATMTVTLHDGFDFWVEGADDLDADVRESLERANAAVIPTVRLTGVEAAYWCQIGDRTHLRWVLPQAEDDAARRAGPAARRRPQRAGRGHPVRRGVPGARPAGAGLGPAAGAPPPRTSRVRPQPSPSGSTRRSRWTSR